MVRILKVFCLTIIVIYFCPDIMYAGRPDKAGTAAASELLIPVGARSIGLAGSSLSSVSGIEALFWNPAGLARSSYQYNVMFSHLNYFAGIKLEYFAASAQVGDLGYIGLSAKAFSIGDIAITTEDFPDGTGEITSPTFLVISGAFSRQITDHISFGISTNYIFEKMADVSASGIAFTGGLQYIGLGGINGLSVGVAVKNVGPTIKYDGEGLTRTGQIDDVIRQSSYFKIEAASNDLPTSIEIGIGYSFPFSDNFDVNISSSFVNNNYSADEYIFGTEIIYSDLLFLRWGLPVSTGSENTQYIFGPSWGFGIISEINGIDLFFDYSFRTAELFGINHVLTLQFGF